MASSRNKNIFVHPTKTAVMAFFAGGALAVIAVLAEGALWTYWLAFLSLFAFLLGADFILRPRLMRLEVKLKLPNPLYIDHVLEGELIVINPRSRTVRVRLKVDTSKNLEEIPEMRGLRLGPGETKVPLKLCARRRGRVEVEVAWLCARGPLGLMSFTRYVGLNRRVKVYPNIHAVSKNAMRFFSTRNLQHGVRVERHRGDGSEFDHLREYVPGFDIRTIDWKVSARHAKLVCRHMRAERNRQVIMAIDSGRLMNEPLEGTPRLDHAITAALTLAFVSLHVGDWVGLVSFDDGLRQYCAPVKGRGGISRLNETASRIAYSTRETNFTLGLMELSRRQTRRALVVVMTDFVDTITAELMMENLLRIARQHRVLFVSLRDPMIQGEAREVPKSLLHLNRSMVAHNLLRDREMVLRRLRRRGIHCIDARPDQVSAELVDQYLEFKRREFF